jgi:hypothetical protein
MFSTVIYMVNTAVNPYVYIVTNRSLRNHGHAKFGKSKKGLEASSTVVMDPQSRGWAITKAVKNANTIARLDSTESKNRLVLRTLTSSSSQLHSITNDTKSLSPKLATIEDVLDGTSQVFQNSSALESTSVCGNQDNDVITDCVTEISMEQSSTVELVNV